MLLEASSNKISVLSKPLNLIGCHGNRMAKFVKKNKTKKHTQKKKTKKQKKQQQQQQKKTKKKKTNKQKTKPKQNEKNLSYIVYCSENRLKINITPYGIIFLLFNLTR